MATLHHNISGELTQELLAPGDNAGNVKSIMLTNIHASNDATISLSIVKLSDSSALNASETYYLLHTIAIPADTSLLLDNSDILTFNNSVNGYSLFLTVGSSDTVNVIIKK